MDFTRGLKPPLFCGGCVRRAEPFCVFALFALFGFFDLPELFDRAGERRPVVLLRSLEANRIQLLW